MLYIAAAIFYGISLELFVLFFLVSFRTLSEKFSFVYRKNYARILILASLFTGLAGGYICYIADGYFDPFQFFTAFFPALFVPFLLMGFFQGSDADADMVVLNMKGGSYTLDSQVTTIGMRATVMNCALWGDKVVRFAGAVPPSSISIRAYCRKEGRKTYLCTGYEVVEKVKYTKGERAERFHSILLIAAALFTPLPVMPMFLWYKKYGQGDNPYAGIMVLSLMIVVSGGCRKLIINKRNRSSKIHYFIFNAMYYLIIFTCLIQILMSF